MSENFSSDDNVMATHLSKLVHELRQPLNLICLVSNNIKRRAEDPDQQLGDDYLVTKMSAIAESINQSSKILDKISHACAVIEAQRQ